MSSTLQRRSARFSQLIPPHRGAIFDPLDSVKGWPLTSRHRPDIAHAVLKRMELRPSDRDRFHRYPLKVDGFPDPRRLPSAGSSCEPFSGLAATRATTRVSAPFRPLRVHRFGLGPFPRSQPRPRTASGARHRLPTSATNPQNKGTPGKRRFHARSSPFRRSPFAPSPFEPRLRAARHRSFRFRFGAG